MKSFDRICNEVEKIPYEEYALILHEKSARVIPALSVLTGSVRDGLSIFGSFIIASVASDGKLSEEEYLLLYPMMRNFFGDEFDYEDSKKLVRELAPEARQLKKLVDEMVDLLGKVDDGLKEDIIVIAMLICAVDGKMNLRERLWIRQLVKD